MDLSHLACVIAILCLAGLSLALLQAISRMQARHTEQMQELLVLMKSETVDQFTASADRLRRQRLEDARGMVREGKVEPGEEVAGRKRPGRDAIWNRAPAPQQPPATEE